MKLVLPMSLLLCPLNLQILAKKEAIMVEEMEIRETENMVLIPMDKGKIQRFAHIIILQYIMSPPTK